MRWISECSVIRPKIPSATPTEPLAVSDTLIQALQNPTVFGVTDPVEVLETGISWVLLAGEYAYKLKKPLNLGFLDYTTLERRHRYCREELRRNRWLAPDLYQAVVAITGSESAPRIGGDGPVLEYAVQMRRFPQSSLLSQRADQGALAVCWLDRLGTILAAFHRQAEVVDADSPWGSPAHVRQWAEDNLATLRCCLTDSPLLEPLEELAAWSDAELTRQESLIMARKRDGWIRQCHGDLHLNNVVVLEDRPVPFDAIEFNPELSAIDVLNELAFLMMDLDERGYRGLGFRCLDRYLAASAHSGGVAVIPFYAVYRALVRAKVAALDLRETTDETERGALLEQCSDYLAAARHWSTPSTPLLVITHGPAGSGKSTLAERLLETLEAVRFRSDVVRRELYNLAPGVRSHAGPGEAIYNDEASRRTYARLRELAAEALGADLPVILDATFLQRAERDAVRAQARNLGVAMIILHCHAPESVLRLRVRARHASGGDASEADEAILDHQLQNAEPLGAEELPYTVCVDTHYPPSLLTLSRRLRRRARVPD